MINTASLQDLLTFKLSKSVANRLLILRNKKENFTDLKELLFVEGLGLKRIEGLCMKILNIDGRMKVTESKKQSERSKTYHQPKISDYILKV